MLTFAHLEAFDKKPISFVAVELFVDGGMAQI
jgi:hypothetical protein